MIHVLLSTSNLLPEDYPDVLRREYGLDEVALRRLPDGTRIDDVIDDAELLAQLHDDDPEDDNADWLYDSSTCHKSAELPASSSSPPAPPQPAPPPVVNAAGPSKAASASTAAAAAPPGEWNSELDRHPAASAPKVQHSSGSPSPASSSGDDDDSKRSKDSSEDSSSSTDSSEAVDSSDEAEVQGAQRLSGDRAGDRYLVSSLLAHRISAGTKGGDSWRRGTKLYKVRWQGCGEEEDTWEPLSRIAPELISSYHAAHATPPTSPDKRSRKEGSALSPSAASPPAKR